MYNLNAIIHDKKILLLKILLWCSEELFIDPAPLVFKPDPKGVPRPPVPMPKSLALKLPSPLTPPTL